MKNILYNLHMLINKLIMNLKIISSCVGKLLGNYKAMTELEQEKQLAL